MHQDPSTYSSNMNILPQFPEHEHLNCPRCDSTNTKFCYYNNYNLSQPRHFCKNCRRYWTKGGTLRKIPIGGGTRKATKRSSTSNQRPNTSSPPTSPATTPPLLPPSPPAQLKPELSSMFDVSNDQGKIRLNHREQSGSFVDVLKPKLSDGSEDGGLDRAPATGIFLRNYLNLNDDDDRIRSGDGGRGESSGCDGGGNGWPNLSISSSGSNFS